MGAGNTKEEIMSGDQKCWERVEWSTGDMNADRRLSGLFWVMLEGLFESHSLSKAGGCKEGWI